MGNAWCGEGFQRWNRFSAHESSLHTAQHALFRRLVENGKGLYDVSKLLGHSNIMMTQRYSHLGENSLRMAVASLEEPNEAELEIRTILNSK